MNVNPKDILIYQAVQDAAFLKRFWAKVEVRGPDECWPWNGCTCDGGYGRIALPHSGPTARAHRVAWIIENGEIPCLPGADSRGTCILHSCDNPPCCNAARCLFAGTNQDNVDDKVARVRHVVLRGDANPARLHPERMARGNAHGSHTHPERMARGDAHGARTHPERLARGDTHPTRLYLADEKRAQIARIFELRKQGLSQRQIAARIGLSNQSVSSILGGRRWPELTAHLRSMG